ncbi:DUF6881 domain-containing protein [Chitinophaga sancti]|uniref:DUF6881 domain-containing protein n=1 Tax=Chitinophaga sancti TaxID=1004 RepID=A0A1K1SNJ5_9BACT|nr:hypothetical protein [Chitinophaga sancti]WQD63930.1 hypothetical protein U0033_05940 [Chitinophaga sancti]WQG90445.1 hypothetical protein SR876_02980 [Chitinophaga sancti]SFW85461.1 hypothetical protein SAMN05661012_05746 [Chitinophaga sancti]
MRYLKVKWIHDEIDDPVLIYSEIGDDDYEQRKIEVYPDNSFGLASLDFEFGGSGLGDAPVPGTKEIEADPQFLPVEISMEEFERIWKEYTTNLKT